MTPRQTLKHTATTLASGAIAVVVATVALAAAFAPNSASAAGSLHVGDLDGVATNRSTWQAKVTITVHDAADNPIAGVTVGGAWGGGVAGTTSCKTGRRGTCTVTSPGAPRTVSEITFRIMGATSAGFTYDASLNHDPDGSSDGTTIAVRK